jgi:hypothetical protein
VRGCGTWTNATEHWPFCLHHHIRLPVRRRDDINHAIMHCYESNGAADDVAALLRTIKEATAALSYLGLVDTP